MNFNLPNKGYWQEKFEDLTKQKNKLEMAKSDEFYKELCQKLEKDIERLKRKQNDTAE